METENTHIVIRGCGAISPLGHDDASTSTSYLNGHHAFTIVEHADHSTPVAALSAEADQKLQELVASEPNYRQLDRSVLMAIYTARQAAGQAGWLTESQDLNHDLAVNIGSSRGATGLFEHHYATFNATNQVASSASPTTTLGNVSSWAAHAVNAGGAQISHSITCSTALMAVANGMAWLKAGMAKRYLAGGTEAPLTSFTLAQMKAIGIYSRLSDVHYPCQPYGTVKQNTFVLGEGAAVFALEKASTSQLQKGVIVIEGIGLGFESIKSKTGISEDGLNFQQSMLQAIAQLPADDNKIDLIITHTPGTMAGDRAELAAIEQIFKEGPPPLTNNKWLIGHTLGASGALSIHYALHILKHQKAAQIPFPIRVPVLPDIKPIRRIMINAAGFGGNAASLILTIF